MKLEIFSRIIPWYELTPARYFIYKDKMTKLWFAIAAIKGVAREFGNNGVSELQGAAYDKYTAYSRLSREAKRLGIELPSLDSFSRYDTIERVVNYSVKG